MKRIRLVILFLLMIKFVFGQVKIIITSLPPETPKDTKIYLASNLNQWNPADQKFELQKEADGRYSIILPEGEGKVEYKFTLGSWQTVEGDANGQNIENRSFNFNGQNQDINDSILSWQKPVSKPETASANVRILAHQFKIPQLKTTRRIWIYLPPDYETSKKRYPVIYMEDGQNLFDTATSFSGEWKVDETLDEFASEKKFEAIVIGVDNGGEERLNEYSPWKNAKYGGGKGVAYTEFLVKTLKPYIDKHYRTLVQPKYTALMGSSMGGLISLYAGVKYPKKFGKLGIFSPSIWFSKCNLELFLNKNAKDLSKTQFYFLAGMEESSDMVSNIEEIIKFLKKKGVNPSNIKTKFDQDGTHSEGYWAREFPAAVLWLFRN